MTTIDNQPIATPTDEFANRLAFERLYSTPGVHPYDEVQWELREVVQKNWKTDEIIFEQRGVEFPVSWSENASTIVTTKYFRGAAGTEEREYSLKQLINRVVGQYTRAAEANGYISDPELLEVFDHELTAMLLNQVFSFNSPVWFNVGTSSPQQVAACFILAVDDSMDSILNWYREEGLIFKGGSGAGLNLSRIRSSKELLRSSGGTASGPVSFMRGADASAGTIKSGGATRRAAKMVVLDVDHPDIEEFVETKAKEEGKIRALRDAGYDMDLGGSDITSVQYQNANNSVRVTDEFMNAVKDGTDFNLRARTDGRTIETVSARTLFQKIAEAAWACADPGMQYDDTINAWHTNPVTGKITASNPCSEYLSLENSSCNLASLNLMKFLKDDGSFDAIKFTKAVEFIITAMDISICFADFPTEAIGDTTRKFRQLGIGYANLGALLMAKGLAYDSDEGRTYAASITSLLTGVSYRRSAQVAGLVGAYEGYAVNREAHIGVMKKHKAAAVTLVAIASGKAVITEEDVASFPGIGTIGHSNDAAVIAGLAAEEWDNNLRLGVENGWRNAQASVLAPTGTIGFMMGCDTTGVEPDFSLKKFKKLVGGGSMEIVNGQVPRALASLGHNADEIEEIVAYVFKHGNVVGAPYLAERNHGVFDCAAGQPRSIAAMGHVNMMAAVQPFLSGAISKTVNLPETATVKEIADIYYRSWELGLKATAVYRDNCKVGQPLSDSKAKKVEPAADTSTVSSNVVERIVEVPRRERLERRRASHTTSFKVGAAEGYMTVGEFEDGRPGELFLKMAKQGSTLSGVMDAFSVSISIALQYGVPLETFVSKFVNQRFEPSGLTDDSEIRMAQSLVDYIFRRLALDYLPLDVREAYGIFSVTERTAMLDAEHGAVAPVAATEVQDALDVDLTVESEVEVVAPAPVAVKITAPAADIHADLLRAREGAQADAPECSVCHTSRFMKRAGACFCCSECGNSTGCS